MHESIVYEYIENINHIQNIVLLHNALFKHLGI